MSPLVLACLIAGVDPELAGHLAVAAKGYARANQSIARDVPHGVVEAGQAFEDYRQFVRANLCHLSNGSGHLVDNGDLRVRGPWLTVAKASSISSVPRRTLYRHLRNGHLGHTTINGTMQIHVQDLIDYVRGAGV